MGRVKLKGRTREPAHDASLPIALDAKQRVLSAVELNRILTAYQLHAETILACPCEGVGNPLLVPPALSRDEVETARSAVLAYVDALSWQKSVGIPGIPAISEEFRAVLGDLLRPLNCRYLQIGLNGNSLRIASEDILPGAPFGLVTRVDVDQGYPSLHIVRYATTVEAKHKLESQTMLAHLSPGEITEILARVKNGASIRSEMLDATRIAVNRGYVIPGAGGEVERWFRTHREDSNIATPDITQAANFLSAMIEKHNPYLDRFEAAVTLESNTLEAMRGTGILALAGQAPSPPNPEK